MPTPRCYKQNPGISARKVDDVVFLVNPDNEALYHLNPVGAALWRLLEDGTSTQEAANLLCQAFPGINTETAKSDIAKLITELAEHNLISPTD